METVKIPEPEQRAAYFVRKALLEFSFLNTQYGFTCALAESSAKGACVRYTSSSMYVEFFYDTYSCELDLRVGQISTDLAPSRENYTLGEVTKLADGHQGRYATATTLDQLDAAITEWAYQLREYGDTVLRGAPQAFSMLQEQSRNSRRQSMEGNRRRLAHGDAEKAWREKDYAEMIRLYDLIQEELSVTESKRLEYAKKRLEEGLQNSGLG